MLTFSRYLEESSRLAPLYHGVKYADKLYQIFFETKGLLPLTGHQKDELLLGRKGDVTPIMGVSFTRSLPFAKLWVDVSGGSGVVLEFDQKALDHRYKIIPIQFWQSGKHNPARYKESLGSKLPRNEYEEFVVTNSKIPLNPYLKAIHINKKKADKVQRDEEYRKSIFANKRDYECYLQIMKDPRVKFY